ncbi:MAG: subtilase, partial [Segatella salivae]
YNLNGQYVGTTLNGLSKGVYIVNGKKVVVK